MCIRDRDVRIDHRSYVRQGLDLIPTFHEGADALCFHLPDISSLVDSRSQVKPLPHIGTVVDKMCIRDSLLTSAFIFFMAFLLGY